MAKICGEITVLRLIYTNFISKGDTFNVKFV